MVTAEIQVHPAKGWPLFIEPAMTQLNFRASVFPFTLFPIERYDYFVSCWSVALSPPIHSLLPIRFISILRIFASRNRISVCTSKSGLLREQF